MNFLKTFLAGVLAFVVGAILIFFFWIFLLLGLAGSMSKSVTLPEEAVLKIDLADMIVDAPSADPLAGIDLMTLQTRRQLPLLKVLQTLEAAAADDHIRGIYLRMGFNENVAGTALLEELRAALAEFAPNLRKVSAERIQTELVKLLASPHPEAFRTVWETGIADVILPEFSAMMVCEQKNPHHRGTVGEHTIWSLQAVPATKVLRLAMLFHDVAKPACRTEDADGLHHFHGHPAMGAEMTRRILRRLKFDNDTIRHVAALVKGHDDRPYPLTERAVRRAILRNGQEAYPDLFEVKRADILAQSDYRQQEKLQYVEEYRRIYGQILAGHQCLTMKDLAVTGKDLIEAGMKPGKELGAVLKQMLEAVVDDPRLNTKEILLERFQKEWKK